MMSEHLKQLEAESIYIFREAAAQFEFRARSCLLYTNEAADEDDSLELSRRHNNKKKKPGK